MARKWRLFFRRVFTLLSSKKTLRKTSFSVTRRLRRAVYVMLGFISVLSCLIASPGFARIPLVNNNLVSSDEPAIAQAAPTLTPNAVSAEQLEQIARENYAAGQFQDAAIAFQQAAQQYEAQGNSLRQALSLSNLSLTHQQLGAWTEATQEISVSLALLETELQQQNTSDRQSAYAQALDIRAKLELSRGRAADAVATWERSVQIHTQLGSLEEAAESQINQARALQSLGLYSRAIIVLQTALSTPEDPRLLLAREAVTDENQTGELTNEELTRRLQKLTNSANTVAALQGLGDSLQIVGKLDQAHMLLEHSLTLAQTLPSPDAAAIASIHLSLGNVTRAEAIAKLRINNLTVKQAVAQLQTLPLLSPVQQELQHKRTEDAKEFDAQTIQALDFYQQAADSSSPAIIQVQAHLNRLNLFLDKQEGTEAEATVGQINALINRFPPTRTAIDAQINFAQSLKRMAKIETFPASQAAQRLQAAQLLATARQQAIALGDPQAESYASGSLGQLYEDIQQWTEAAALTQQALEKVNAVSVINLPQNVYDADLAYRWQYQLGRIRAAQNDKTGAIAAYEAAAKILNGRLSLDVVSSNLSYQFSFNQDAQQPVHQAWMDLLLSDNPSQPDLQQVREISTSLLETQLNSFLQEPCAVVTPQQVDQVVEESAQKTAIFYPVILPDRLEVIVKLPGTSALYRYHHEIPAEQLLETLSNLQIALEEDYTFALVKSLSKQLYDWMVKPVASQLEAKQIDTLVFTLDRRLQSIPMAALYDGEQYLIEKYAVSEILGLKFDSSKQSLQPDELKVIGAGLSIASPAVSAGGEDIRGLFLPLGYVKDELQVISESKIHSVTLLDEQFTLENFNTQLNEEKFPIVHLATHGQFSFDPKRTFLLTADPTAVDVDQLAGLFRVRGQVRLDAIELLILNACETASGDDLATLGIAGAAVRAGARSAIASLWTLDDAPSVSFARTLYENLQRPNVSRAEAVRQAQLVLLQNPQYKHPRYWSPYILAGNWLPLTTSLSVSTTDSRISN
jgi:CHAT domain-containing protein